MQGDRSLPTRNCGEKLGSSNQLFEPRLLALCSWNNYFNLLGLGVFICLFVFVFGFGFGLVVQHP